MMLVQFLNLCSAHLKHYQRDGRTYPTTRGGRTLPWPGIPVHTLFQVSSRGLLYKDLQRAVSSTFLLNYGDLGLVTFDNLDGEMVVLDGGIYQARSDGTLTRSSTTQEHPSPLL